MFSRDIRCPDGDNNLTYGVIQKGRSSFWEVTEPLIVRKKFICMCVQFWMVIEIELFEYPGFCLRGLDEEWHLQKEGGYTRRITRERFGCCYQYKET
jgi:hypothetical protein